MSIIGKTLGKLTGADQAANAAQGAANAQIAAGEAQIAESRRQFDAFQKLLSPYVQTGEQALGAQGNLIGLNGAQSQQSAIDMLKSGPRFQSMLQQGENSILSNASATGGLRGGNTQAALAQFSPQLLAQLINDQYSQLGGLSQLGQNSAAGVGNAGLNTGQAIGGVLANNAAAQAGGILAKGNVAQQGFGTALNLGGLALGAFGGLGGGATSAGQNYFGGLKF